MNISIVYIWISRKSDTPQDIFQGGVPKPYAVFSVKQQSIDVMNKLNELGDAGLHKLKILKRDETFNSATCGIEMRVDNYSNIWNKLNNKIC